MADWDFPNAATPPGSGPYYVVRFSPAPQRDRLAQLFAWRAELTHILAQAKDPGVARIKLDWWRDELARARGGTARHPLAVALAPLLQEYSNLQLWHGMLDATAADVRLQQPADHAAFAAHCDRLGGALGELLVGTPGACAEEVAAARRCGAYHEGVTRLRDLALHLRRQHCPVPRELLQAAGLGRLERAAPDRLAASLERALAPLAEAVTTAAGPATERIGPARRLAAQAHRLHDAMRQRRYPVLAEQVELSPLGYLWSAWRA